MTTLSPLPEWLSEIQLHFTTPDDETMAAEVDMEWQDRSRLDRAYHIRLARVAKLVDGVWHRTVDGYRHLLIDEGAETATLVRMAGGGRRTEARVISLESEDVVRPITEDTQEVERYFENAPDATYQLSVVHKGDHIVPWEVTSDLGHRYRADLFPWKTFRITRGVDSIYTLNPNIVAIKQDGKITVRWWIKLIDLGSQMRLGGRIRKGTGATLMLALQNIFAPHDWLELVDDRPTA